MALLIKCKYFHVFLMSSGWTKVPIGLLSFYLVVSFLVICQGWQICPFNLDFYRAINFINVFQLDLKIICTVTRKS